MLAIVDYGMGNVGSVQNALSALGIESKITAEASDIENASHIVLPGVGSFARGMKRLEEKNLPALLRASVVEKKKPFLGICLGMQLLSLWGEEGGGMKGLGWIKGSTRRLEVPEKGFRLPHVGWNDATPEHQATLFRGVRRTTFYFVHSYHLVPDDGEVVAARTDYGGTFVSAIESGNIFGVQFHPEKSQREGLQILKNFVACT
ncbi:imidazole glycerol phosphate synthase, glutamine amidotransferase subunit [Candidatus Kaiserbacteria bacterium RIFCSPLOWO2_01_FULL_54_13]|uniref:Imidazole glycerol phosphate synthase subunit HisH n=1 Tax=Candidatus Kaiserbacteria bacterium RIFCSPLOWO2_01_FULL_54_13 TaxID=1798512 RepID=A0A1F6F129_9BACT|nr:MAG: imidazole glycerol phosphate synthase, glutamine amidotransferase subunit [Candidatus Kaiserbacteria bacterium RIFCSPLOWO2_01_FULL_54_13]